MAARAAAYPGRAPPPPLQRLLPPLLHRLASPLALRSAPARAGRCARVRSPAPVPARAPGCPGCRPARGPRPGTSRADPAPHAPQRAPCAGHLGSSTSPAIVPPRVRAPWVTQPITNPSAAATNKKITICQNRATVVLPSCAGRRRAGASTSVRAELLGLALIQPARSVCPAARRPSVPETRPDQPLRGACLCHFLVARSSATGVH